MERLGASPIKPYLAQIEHLESKKELPALLAQLHLRSAGDGMLFQLIAFASSGGLGLPDRDYYTRN